ncbi:hypothetical protein L596_027623 [Steinernema carpocapsae]|uniref:glucuronosyltransferase n=1 Tax=Steinernema carpocapsae TaxID=34508 RepID=A0A4U5LW25_STECR|nr:hypothetical protein L596_027623 [Steinernema carpocapsae]
MLALEFFSVLLLFSDVQAEGNAFVFTHSMSTSHLKVLFNLADKLADFDIYDIRWPIIEVAASYKAPERFHPRIFNRSMVLGIEIKEDKIGWKSSGSEFLSIMSVVAKIPKMVLMPCDFEDELSVERELPSNISIVDPFSSMCAIARSRKLGSRYVLASALIEPMTLTALSGGDLPLSYAISNIIAKPIEDMNFFYRVANSLAHFFFYFFVINGQLAAARWFYGADPVFAPVEPTFVFVNSHQFVNWPIPKTFARIDFGTRSNVANEDSKASSIDEDLLKFMENSAFQKIVVFSMSTFTDNGDMPEEIVEGLCAKSH